jgi:predicted nucleic acid-binding Zn ribbon protein
LPTYDYICDICKTEKEVLHSMDELQNPKENTKKEITCCNQLMHRTFNVGHGGYAVFGSSTPEQKQKALKKRADDHYKTRLAEGATHKKNEIIKKALGGN